MPAPQGKASLDRALLGFGLPANMAWLTGSPSNTTGSKRLTPSPWLVIPPGPAGRRRCWPHPRRNRHHRDLAPLHLSRFQHHDPPRRRRRRPRRSRGAEERQGGRIAALRKPAQSFLVAGPVRFRRLREAGEELAALCPHLLLDRSVLGVERRLRRALRLSSPPPCRGRSSGRRRPAAPGRCGGAVDRLRLDRRVPPRIEPTRSLPTSCGSGPSHAAAGDVTGSGRQSAATRVGMVGIGRDVSPYAHFGLRPRGAPSHLRVKAGMPTYAYHPYLRPRNRAISARFRQMKQAECSIRARNLRTVQGSEFHLAGTECFRAP